MSAPSPAPRVDYLRYFLERAAPPLALIRAIEARHLAALDFPPPILDLGCGDGLLGQALFGSGSSLTGLDLSASALAASRDSPAYRAVVLASSADMPFGDASFGSVLANSVLEHVLPLDQTLAEVCRVLRPGGRFVFTVPHDRTPENHLYHLLLVACGLRPVALALTRAKARVFKEYHYFSPQAWASRLMSAGLYLDWHRYIHPPLVGNLYDVLLPLGLAAMVRRRVFQDMAPRVSWPKPLWHRLLRKHYLAEKSVGGTLLLVARKPC